MKKSVTNYGKLLAEIQYYEGIGNEFMAEKLSSYLEKARKKDLEIRKINEEELKRLEDEKSR